jgi:hypothetical protein
MCTLPRNESCKISTAYIIVCQIRFAYKSVQHVIFPAGTLHHTNEVQRQKVGWIRWVLNVDIQRTSKEDELCVSIFLQHFFFLWLDSPIRAWASSFRRGFTITHIWDTPQSVGFLWTSDQPVAETSTWQHTTLTRDRHPCPRWDSNPRS